MSVIADLIVTLSADATRLDAGLNQANKGITGFAQSAGKSLIGIGASMTGLTAPLLAFGVTGVNVAADFENSMAEVSARTGIVGADLQSVSDFALQMGADTSFSAQQSADAFLQLLSSGQSAEQAIATLPAVLDLAAASGADLGQTADAVTDIMAQFGLSVGTTVPDNFLALQTQMSITDSQFTAFGNDSEAATKALEPLAVALGVGTDELYDMWNASKQLTPEISNMAAALGISESDWANYISWLEGAGDAAYQVTPEIKKLIDTTGLSGSRLAEMFNPDDFSGAVLISDILAQAAGASSASIQDLSAGFANVGGVANAFNLDVETTAAILAVFAENGTKGAEAGTALKSMLVNFSSDTAQKAFVSLGVSMYDAQGNMRDFETVIGDLDTVLDTLPVEQQNALMLDLAGSYGITGLTALRGSISIGDMKDSMAGSADAATVAEARMNTFKGKVDSLIGSVQTLQIRAFTPLIQNSLTPLVGVATTVVNAITDFTVANPALTDTLMDMGIAAVIAGPAIAAIGVAMVALASPLVLTGVAVTALVIGLVGLASAFDNFNGASVVTKLTELGSSLTGLTDIQIGSKTIGDWTLKISQAFEDAVGGIVIGDTTLGALTTTVSEKLGTALAGVKIDASSLTSLPGELVKTVQFAMAYDASFSSIADLVGASIGRALGEVVIDVSPLTNLASELWLSVRVALQNAGPGFGDFELDTSGLSTLPQQLADQIGVSFAGGFNVDTGPAAVWMNQNSQMVLDTIVSIAGIVFGGPLGMLIGGANLIASAIENDFLGIGTFLDTSGIGSAVTTALNDVKAIIDSVIASVFGGGGQAATTGADFFDVTSMIAPEGGADTSGLSQIANDISMAITVIKDVASSIGGDVIKGLKDFGEGVSAFVSGITGSETSGLYEAARPIIGFIGGLVVAAAQIAGFGVGAILSGLGAALGPFGEGIGGLVTTVSNLGEGDIGGALKSFGGAIVSFGQGLLAFPIAIADSILTKIEEITGIQLPDVATGLAGWSLAFNSAWLGLQIVVDNIQRGVRMFVLDIQITVLNFIADFRQRILDATGGRIDISPDVEVAMGNLSVSREAFPIADQIEAELKAGLAAGSIDLSDSLAGSITYAPEALANAMSLTGKQAVEDGLRQAFTVTDQHTIDILTPLAVALGIDIAGVEAQVKADLAAGNYDTTITANVAVNAVITFLQNVPGMISDGIAAAGGFLTDLGAAVAPPDGVPTLAVGTPLVRSDGLIYAHAGEAVLTAAENKAYRAWMQAAAVASPSSGGSSGSGSSGSSRGGDTYNITSWGQSPREVAQMLQRETELGGL